MSDTHHFVGISGGTCLAKEDPDTDASFATRGAAGNGLVIIRPPMRYGQIQLCQLVVTNHNSFSVSPAV